MARRFPLALALAVALVLGTGWRAPSALEATPEAGTSRADHPLVGTWLMDISPEDPSDPPTPVVFHADETAIGVGRTGISAGAWDATGPRSALVTLVRILETEDFTGSLTVRASIDVDATGAAFSGDASYTAADAQGTVIGTDSGPLIGSRVTPGPVQDGGSPHDAIPTWVPGPAEGGAQPATPVAQGGSPALVGTAPDTLPAGEPGAVSIVFTGQPFSFYGIIAVMVLLRNNTGEDVHDIRIDGAALDADGEAVADARSSLMSIAPYRVPPGGLAITYLTFTGVDTMTGVEELPAGGTYDLRVTHDTLRMHFSLDMVVSEIELVDDGVIGMATNPHDGTMSGGVVLGACFDADGEPVGLFYGRTDERDIPAGTATPFSGEFLYTAGVGTELTASDDCDSYLVGVVAPVLEPITA